MYKLTCEYDYGQDYIVFTTPAVAMDWLAKQIEENGWQAEVSVQSLVDDGLAYVTKLEVISG